MNFKQIQEFINNQRYLNEDFLDDFSPDEQKSASKELAQQAALDNVNTFRVFIRITVEDKNVDYGTYGFDDINFKSGLSFIEESVKNFDILGSNTSDMKLTVAITQASPFNQTILDKIELGSLNDYTWSDMQKTIRDVCQKVVDSNVLYNSGMNVDFFCDFTYNPFDADTSERLFNKQSMRLMNNMMHFIRVGSALSPLYTVNDYTTGGDFIYINNTNPDLYSTNPEFSIGGPSGLDPEGWNTTTIEKLYAFLSNKEWVKTGKGKDIKLPYQLNPILIRMHKLLFDEAAQENYIYQFVGYDDQTDYECRTLKTYIILRPKDYDSEYAGVKEMCDWIKDNIIYKLSVRDLNRMAGKRTPVTVEIRCSMGMKDFKPTLNWPDGSKKYDNTITRAGGPSREVNFKISFHDADFDRFGRPKRKSVGNMSKQFLDAFSARVNYIRDMEDGLYGRYAQKHASELSK